ncbi:MAG: ScnB-like protein [Pseudomonadota bacterium]
MAEDRSWHDMGGLPAGDIDAAEHDYALWEKRVDALYMLCTARGWFAVDALRRALEDMGEDVFENHSYYERWIEAVNRNLVEAGVYSTADLSAKLAEVKARGETYAEASLGDG